MVLQSCASVTDGYAPKPIRVGFLSIGLLKRSCQSLELFDLMRNSKLPPQDKVMTLSTGYVFLILISIRGVVLAIKKYKQFQ